MENQEENNKQINIEYKKWPNQEEAIREIEKKEVQAFVKKVESNPTLQKNDVTITKKSSLDFYKKMTSVAYILIALSLIYIAFQISQGMMKTEVDVTPNVTTNVQNNYDFKPVTNAPVNVYNNYTIIVQNKIYQNST